MGTKNSVSSTHSKRNSKMKPRKEIFKILIKNWLGYEFTRTNLDNEYIVKAYSIEKL